LTPLAVGDARMGAPVISAQPFSTVLPEVEVAVLGPVVVHGAARPFRRSAAVELVVYLSLHRRSVAYTEWPVAIWPDRPVSLATVHSTASDARRALGRSADGTWHLPREGGHLRLAESVTTDVERFASLASSGDRRNVVEAMRLVRGPLFCGLRHADWAVFDGTQAAVESLVVTAALRGAELLTEGGGAEAEWVVRRALVVSPYDERLYRALLRATAAQGNRLALRSTMTQLLTMAGDVPGPPNTCDRPGETASLNSLHPDTAALYRDLLRGAPAVGGTPTRL
jgi:DNA-binding SARP family transcriptional activator